MISSLEIPNIPSVSSPLYFLRFEATQHSFHGPLNPNDNGSQQFNPASAAWIDKRYVNIPQPISSYADITVRQNNGQWGQLLLCVIRPCEWELHWMFGVSSGFH